MLNKAVFFHYKKIFRKNIGTCPKNGFRNFRRKKIRRRKIGRTEFSPHTTGTNSMYGNMAEYINLVQTAIGASNRTNSTGEYRLFGAGIVCDLPKKYDLPL